MHLPRLRPTPYAPGNQIQKQGKRVDIKVGVDAIAEASKKLSNWGRWGESDQIGTLNFVTPVQVAAAAKLVKKGKVFGMGIPLDGRGPQTATGFGGRWNPILTMLATGTDCISERQGFGSLGGYADDAIYMPVQAATHWDSLGHVFYQKKTYNGHDAGLVDSRGCSILGIEHTRDRMVGRGVLLDVARFKGIDALDDGYGISNDELDAVAGKQGVTIREGDFVIVRTGQMERCLKANAWGGYAGGNAPGVKFENCYWAHRHSIAAICSDTWGVEVRPNETSETQQPWHLVVIPAMGLTMGEMFFVKELAEDCAADGIYEFMFAGPPLVITHGTGSPINPLAIK